MGQIIRSLASV